VAKTTRLTLSWPHEGRPAACLLPDKDENIASNEREPQALLYNSGLFASNEKGKGKRGGAATTIIKNIRLLKGAAVLAERKAVTPSLDLKRLNLFYGFNGSGKSTLSRIFAALQHGKRQDRLPEGCTFEIEMSDGARFTYAKALTGLEKRVCVFNTDFIAENFRWETGVANPVFYIGAGQAEAADQLKALEATLPAAQTRHEGEAKVLNVREKAFNEYKRVLARTVAERLRQAARYEAPQFVADMDKLGASVGDKLSDADLDAATATCARSEPPAKVKLVVVPVSTLLEMIEAAVELAPKSIGSIVVGRLEDHPQMVPWVKQGQRDFRRYGERGCGQGGCRKVGGGRHHAVRESPTAGAGRRQDQCAGQIVSRSRRTDDRRRCGGLRATPSWSACDRRPARGRRRPLPFAIMYRRLRLRTGRSRTSSSSSSSTTQYRVWIQRQ
jgi:hypothetical protein